MKKVDILNKIKSFFESEETELKFVDVETGDGKILRTPSLEEGQSIVEIVDEVETELEDGQYETKDGLILNVENNVIKTIKEVEEDDVESEEETELGETKKDFKEVLKEFKQSKQEFDNDGKPSAYIELPVGTHIIGNTTYVVEEVIEEEGTDNEYRYNVIVEMFEGDSSNEDTEMSKESEDKLIEEVFSAVKNLKKINDSMKLELKDLKTRFNKFSDEPSEEETRTKVTFSELTKEDKIKIFSKR